MATSYQAESRESTEAKGIVFEENFDSQPDWNEKGQLEPTECSAEKCLSDTYPPNWSFYRSVPYVSGLSPVASIRRLPGKLADHSGSGSGKAFIVFNQSSGDASWPGDGILGKYFGATTSYPDLYIRFWLRTQPGWKKTPTAALSKIFRAGHWLGTQNIFQWDTHTAPMIFWDFQTFNGYDDYAPLYRCDPNDYFCMKQKNDYQKSADTKTGWATGRSPRATDGVWHRYDFHIKMNTTGQYNGTYAFAFDGTTYYNKNDVNFRETDSEVAGWNYIALGGNSNNKWATGPNAGEQWYAIDDLVVSTVPLPDNYTIHNRTGETIDRSTR